MAKKIKKTQRKSTPKKKAFLAAYAACGNLSEAARIAKCDRTSHYLWMQDEAYQDDFSTAHGIACDSLEEEARRRAVEGVVEDVYYQGTRVGKVKKYSDTLLIFLMKGAMPERYRERRESKVTGKIDHNHTGSIQVYIPENNRHDNVTDDGDQRTPNHD